MYGNSLGYANEAKVACAQEVDRNPTVGENLEMKISMLKTELKRLEESRETLGPLLNMRIRDVRDAMQY